ncbi:Swi5-domain-containing protein [Saitoella complicata NRRL Y-17804]|uniref:Uncharacterized protein n=1 Tax=Saitoella complicata (strain BCRC 22490 / CBS 7301 / JCM 7358 / NBRC 10748 / NRRL Y-17804) TaxID=698492 RepID=A0A0E9NM56_SAICN|nr:Swi5-domain-containing protein [Saitoella complicata NRRL Y-17804]ODQ52463.1 Swi5-domain-containing protein [Saitoella complicata NRRL Y-17804]GAO50500.1 hypothetical protein G7K_4624-t1 [Saitoella complicata NRRL Y-17804]
MSGLQKDALRAKNAALEARLAELKKRHAKILSTLADPENPEKTVARHIKLLHDYNEIRDAAMGLIGKIADHEQVRVKDVMGRFGIGEGDE